MKSKNGKARPPLADWQKPWHEQLRRWIQEKGYAPTFKELAQMRGMTPKAAWDAMASLEAAGYITWAKEDEGRVKSRSIQLIA